MVERCIMIFPEFSNIKVIEEIRGKYDPLARHVRPHITLIFPFHSDIATAELETHLKEVLEGVIPFELTMQGITPVQSFGNYLFLNIAKGQEEIKDLHKALYTGLLGPYHPQWLKSGGFYPHMTVGKLEQDHEYREAAEAVKDRKEIFNTIVKKISVEIIDDNEDSIIELEFPLV